jgi:hypothetical protein
MQVRSPSSTTTYASCARATCRRTCQRTLYRPGELLQFDLFEPREPIPVTGRLGGVRRYS